MIKLYRICKWTTLLFGLGLMFGGILELSAQSTTVSVTVVDPSTQVWANGSIGYIFQANPQFQGPYQWNGAALPNNYLILTTVALNSSGSATFSLPSNTAITPVGSQWKFTVCPNASTSCTTVSTPVTGTSQDISSTINAALKSIAITAATVPFAYTDSEVATTIRNGGTYYNTTPGSCGPKYWDGTKWNCYGESNIVVDYISLGGKCDATYNGSVVTGTDNTPILQSILSTFQAAGKGVTILFPIGGCRFHTHLVLPNDNVAWSGGSTNPYARQVPIRLEGAGPDAHNGQRFAPIHPFQSTVFIMDYPGTGTTGGTAEQSIFAGGSGYAVGDTGTVGGTCSGATYKVAAVDTGTYSVGTAPITLTHTGYVQQVYISAKGSACTVADNTATATGGSQPGSGTGLTLNVAAVTGGAFAKFETYGMGLLEIDHMVFYDPTGDALPFFRTTGTELNIHDMQVWGTSLLQDAFVLGGTSNAFVTINNPLAAFQGYNTKFRNVNFDSIRRAVYQQSYNQATTVEDSFVDLPSGTNLPEGAAFEENSPQYDSVSGQNGFGTTTEGIYLNTRIEMPNYYYAFKFTNSPVNTIINPDIEDVNIGGTVNAYGIASINYGSTNNNFSLFVTDNLPDIIEDASIQVSESIAGSTVVSSTTVSKFPLGATFFGGTYGIKNPFTAWYSKCLTPATSGASCNATGYQWQSNYWNGSASSLDTWLASIIVFSGTNGASNFNLTHTGSSGGSLVNFSADFFGWSGTFGNGTNLIPIQGNSSNTLGTFVEVNNTSAGGLNWAAVSTGSGAAGLGLPVGAFAIRSSGGAIPFYATSSSMGFLLAAYANCGAIGTSSGVATCSTPFAQLSGTTSSIGGGSLTAGTCASGTATVTGAVVGHTVGVSASDGTLPNALATLSASVTSINTVTVQVCAIAIVTPTAKTYNVTTY